MRSQKEFKMSMTELNNGNLAGTNLAFIVGCPRSGTTWLQRLLAAHPQIKTGQESQLFDYVGPQLRAWKKNLNSGADGRGGTGLACYLDEREFLAILKKYLGLLLAPMLKGLQPGQIFLEKTPGHALFVPEIAELLPQAKIIHLVRDPRDVAASLLAASRGWGQGWAPRRGKKAVRMWWQHVAAAQKAAAHLAPGHFLEIHYEELHRDPASTLREVSRFLDLSWADADIASAVTANAAEEIRQGNGTPIPVYGEHGKRRRRVVHEPEGFVRKARPGSWREDLTLLERWQVWYALHRIVPEWKRYAKG